MTLKPEGHHVHFHTGTRARSELEEKIGAPAWRLNGGRSGRHG
jgi:hypothetical protein